MSIEKIIDSLKKEYPAIVSYSNFNKFPLEDAIRTSLEEYGREVIDKCIEALPRETEKNPLFPMMCAGFDKAVKESKLNLNNLK